MAFKRYDGLRGSLPQKFIDRRLPKCPMCGSGQPNWTLDTKSGWTAHRYLFRCSACEAILSATVADVTGLANTMITTMGLLKKLSGKQMVAYFKVDDPGNRQATDQHAGGEYTLDQLSEMASEL